jgi:hypothetical protein
MNALTPSIRLVDFVIFSIAPLFSPLTFVVILESFTAIFLICKITVLDIPTIFYSLFVLIVLSRLSLSIAPR